MKGFKNHTRTGRVGNVCHSISLPPRRVRRSKGPRLARASGSAAPVDGVGRVLTVEEAIQIVRSAGKWPEGAPDAQVVREREVLERRVTKLVNELELREEELRRVLVAPEKDGIASIYDSVQGLQEGGKRGDKKRQMMAQIYEANLKLQETVTSLRQTAE